MSLTRSVPAIMFLAKAFQTDPRPRQEAKSLVENNYCVYVLAWDRDYRFTKNENVEGATVRSYRLMNSKRASPLALVLGGIIFQIVVFLGAMKLIGRIKKRSVVHAHDFNTLLPAYLLRLTRLSVALIYDCHELSYAAYSECFNNFLGSLIRILEQHLVRHVDAIITVSRPMAEYLRRFNAETKTIYNCPSISVIPRISKRRARLELGLPVDAFIVSSIGTIRYDSRLDLMLTVSALTRDHNVHYVVVGDGPLQPEFRRAAQEVDSTRLTVSSRVSREAALTYIVASDLTWAVYRNSLGFLNPRLTMPWKFFESLACGVPVIVERGTVRAAFVKELECGRIVESDDPYEVAQVILELAASPEQHHEMCSAAKRASASSFNWELMSTKLINVYEHMVLACLTRQNLESMDSSISAPARLPS
jgi:glycosyltransferase involved in cell wall biosynthesis